MSQKPCEMERLCIFKKGKENHMQEENRNSFDTAKILKFVFAGLT
jgi:hypothetical protein